MGQIDYWLDKNGLAYLLLNRHRLGNHIFAVGGNAVAAAKTGINPDRVKMIAFMLCSLLATFAGVISATRVNTVAPIQVLIGLELQAIVACTIGGVFLFGGRGSVLGIVLGAAFVATVDDLLILTRTRGQYFQVFLGFAAIGAVALNTWIAGRKED